MSDPSSLSGCRFLSGLAVLGVTPLTSVPAAAGWFQEQPHFTGDEIDRAHALFLRPSDPRPRGEPIQHEAPSCCLGRLRQFVSEILESGRVGVFRPTAFA